MKHPFSSPTVRAAFDAMPDHLRKALLLLRDLIFDTAATLPAGPIEESLKWGQPSYTTTKTKAGTPIRLGITKTDSLAIFAHCQTTVISDFRALAPPDMEFDGNRALHLNPDQDIPVDEITPLIRAALTYRL